VLPRLQPYQFVVECKVRPGDADVQGGGRLAGLTTWRAALNIGATQPDLIQVLPPAAARAEWEAVAEDEVPPVALQAVLPPVMSCRCRRRTLRLRLRVIDIKLAAEPGAHYFAEVVYYSITLAAWLVEHGWDDRFVVIAAPAVWPGSYDASHIRLLHNRCRKEGRTPAPEELARRWKTISGGAVRCLRAAAAALLPRRAAAPCSKRPGSSFPGTSPTCVAAASSWDIRGSTAPAD